jgi:hypothetical protein
MCWNASERSFSRNEMKEMQWKKVICFGVSYLAIGYLAIGFGVGYLAIGYLAIGYLAIGFGVGYF